MSETAVRKGVFELVAGEEPMGRVQRPGGGRKRVADLDPGLRSAPRALVEPEERVSTEPHPGWRGRSLCRSRLIAARAAVSDFRGRIDGRGFAISMMFSGDPTGVWDVSPELEARIGMPSSAISMPMTRVLPPWDTEGWSPLLNDMQAHRLPIWRYYRPIRDSRIISK